MVRKIQYIIEKTYEGATIAEFLKEKEYSRGILIALKRSQEGITKNGVWARVNEKLHTGDILKIELPEEEASSHIVPWKCAFDILYEDEDILVVNKPYNMPVHPSVNHYLHTLANGLAYYYEKQGKACVFRCINRLDRDTTGVTIIAKNMLSASILSARMKKRQLIRTYVAFVEGKTKEEGTIDLPIGRLEGSIIKRQVDEKAGKPATTHYETISRITVEGKEVSVVKLRLETGRTHQIRVHMAHIGHPLLGDFLYNQDNHMLTRQGLHAASITFVHPISGEYMHLTAPLPEDMAKLIKKCDENQRAIYEMRSKILKDKVSPLNKAKEEGME